MLISHWAPPLDSALVHALFGEDEPGRFNWFDPETTKEHLMVEVNGTFRRKLRRFAPFDGMNDVFFPPVQIGDVNGDGRSDLLVGRHPQKLRFLPGATGPKLLGEGTVAMEVVLPKNERNTRLADLNHNGKADIVLHHRGRGEPDRVVILMSR